MTWADEGPRFPWRELWRDPVATFGEMLDEDPTRNVLVLLLLPAPLAVTIVELGTRGGLLAPLMEGLVAFVAVAIVAWARALVVAAVGARLGGRGSFQRVLAAYAWTQPVVAAITILLALADAAGSPSNPLSLASVHVVLAAVIPIAALLATAAALRVTVARALLVEVASMGVLVVAVAWVVAAFAVMDRLAAWMA